MKQRVALALATVWLASIVGASVPSGETTASSTPRPPGPSPDQYTPLLRNPRYYSQDDYGQDWMNDEPSRIKVANRQEKYGHGKTPITDSDRSLSLATQSNGFSNRKQFHADEYPAKPYHFQSNDMKTQSELDREAMRLASIKVAFDEPIDSEISDEEDWINDDDDFEEEEEEEEEEKMQQDGFVSDDTFEDEGPGSVEVYKLDLYKDRSILSPKLPSRKNYLKNKSKIPKKVEAVDRLIWKSKDPEGTKQYLPKTVSKFDHQHSDEFLSTKSFKERIFGVGGVPELQVGCEGVEGPSQREKRSKSDKIDGLHASQSAHATPVYLDPDYDSDEESDGTGETDELFKLLAEGNPENSPSNNENRGDMNPRIKTPADLEVQKEKLPLRGDLGPSGDPNIMNGTQAQSDISNGNQSALKTRRLLSLEEEISENSRTKRSSDWGFPETSEGEMNKDVDHWIDGTRGHHRGGLHKQENRRRRGNEKRHRRREKGKRSGNEIRKKNKPARKNKHQDHVQKEPEYDTAGSQSPNLLGQLGTRQDPGRREVYPRRQQRHLGPKRRDGKAALSDEENARRTQEYRRRNTPIPHRRNPGYNRQGKVQHPNPSRTSDPWNRVPEASSLRVPPVHDHRRSNEQRKPPVGHINRTSIGDRQSTERPKTRGSGQTGYQRKSPEEIKRLNALPVQARIIINDTKSTNEVPTVGSRFGEDPDITYQGLNPSSNGREVPGFPSKTVTKAPVEGPSPCVWAVMTCCSNKKRLATCFEAKGCFHGYWDDPCSQEKMSAAIRMITKYTEA